MPDEATNGDAGQAGPGGDLGVALRQEREAHRETKATLASFEERFKALESRFQPPQGAPEKAQEVKADASTLGQFMFTKEEWADGDVESMNAKLTGLTQVSVEMGARIAMEKIQKEQRQQMARQVTSEFAIFSDADTELAKFAAKAATDAVSELPANATPKEVRDAIDGVAKYFSSLKANKSQEAATGKPAPISVGGGTAPVAHMGEGRLNHKTFNEARAAATEAALKFSPRR